MNVGHSGLGLSAVGKFALAGLNIGMATIISLFPSPTITVLEGAFITVCVASGAVNTISALRDCSREVAARNELPKQGASQKVRQFQALKRGAYTP